ncbi:TRANSPOSON TY4-H GAG POLYPROTEIN-RELATED [Plasmopara halstedii]|uniref:TRANSPOSON TY4-H GAG POLYPROTEIN-RELATED n=1 Tax=Plasmopara halstedii TaxID=4781 RepID=A0A0N7L5H9_PLAHL|nr:TRANSPOSON TY4-H GAG POLYPROTEIN-RELATED [Plasmopara halstedii]CEG41523.1 TRANSPOSON TY4-H GAG POLYPROTEIN-RELATED [Plasmopara halstedii]|eukprot:XP_024577892.1 TRANSPOSON TY4-H GAG POLYPROTEIN-RELATED [Plasmopara halstedii]
MDRLPYQVWTERKFVLTSLKVFGCHAFVTVPKEKRSKIDARSLVSRDHRYNEVVVQDDNEETDEDPYNMT